MKPSAIFDDFVSLLYPTLCVACGKNLFKNEECLCTLCRYRLPRTFFLNEEDNPVARLFWGRVRIEQACAYYYFNKGTRIQRLIHALKYRARTDAGILAGELFGRELSSATLYKNVNAIIPVPLHPKKLKIRGFNQSEVISEGIAKGMNLPLETGSIIRTTASETQTRKSRFKRWENVKSIFKVPHPSAIAGKHILLVDDVATTGATLEACAAELLKVEGCKVSIAALTYATRVT
ncbi:MAG: ComF family protein [Bacteroidetes bacterium]|nr:ComF family protein [Bacteroidota bacterium]